MQIHKLKPYFILDCNNLKEIQSECLPIILESVTDWNGAAWVDIKNITKKLFLTSSSLRTWVKQYNWKIKTIAVTYLDGTDHRKNLPIHIDQLPVLTRVNIPVLNCDQATVNLYSISESYRNTIDLSGTDYCALNINECTKIEEYILYTPIVFNTQIPHSVDPIPNAQYPRIMLTLTLFDDISHYLK